METRGRGHSRSARKHARLALYAFVALLTFAAFTIGCASGESLGSSWAASTAYSGPGIEGQSCVTSVDFSTVYCVGGNYGSPAVYTNNVEYAPLSTSGGVGNWVTASAAEEYPFSASGESCVALEGSIYCIGGSDGSSRTTDVYYAQPSLTGLGGWTAAPSYPLDVFLQSCVGSGAGVYCVGGFTHTTYVNATYSTQYTNRTEVAQVSASSGLSLWSNSTAYPERIADESCVTYSGYIYCVGGDTGYTGRYGNGFRGTSSVYYAPLSSGIGAWSSTTPYPTAVYGQSCVVQYEYVYCIGGYTKSGSTANVYYASLSSSGVGQWAQATSYPVDVVSESCITFYDSIDCIGGLDGTTTMATTYSNGVAPPTDVTVTATSTSTSTSTKTSVETETVTSTTTSLSTVSISKTLTTTSVVKTVSSVTSTETVTKTTTSTTTLGSTGTSGSVQTPSQAQSGPVGSLLQVEPAALGTALGAALGVVLTIAAFRLIRRKKKPIPVVEP